MPRRSLPAFLPRSVFVFAAAASLHADVAISVDPAADRAPISPFIYGSNAILPGVSVTLLRQGGNRMTGYNWENNASNAGSDYLQQSDDYLTWIFGITGAPANVPGLVVTHFQDDALAAGTAYTIATLPMAGYVAADKSGPVSATQAAPSSRWVSVENTKPTALSLTPDTTDGKVYTDELLNFLVHRYGPASSPTGIKGYDLDNEPDLWSNTHPRLHPAQPTCVEFLARSIDMAKTVKRMDPSAETLGFVSYGFEGYLSFQDASDWSSERTKGNYHWFVDYYLDRMKQASAAAGERLLDVLDLHNYSEAIGGGHRINDSSYTDYTNLDWNKARLQAPRTYWDPTYRENSWIAQYNSSFLPLLPTIQQSIATFYPGTKLALTEYNFGGEDHISGGIAEADTLGIFGKYGVYLAALWPLSDTHTYAAAAFRLYLDYDGAGGRFGDTSVHATNSDAATASVYAAAENGDPTRLHLIVLNKSYDAPTTFNLSVGGGIAFKRARVFAFDSASATITERTAVDAVANNQFTYTLPALTAAHFLLEALPAISMQPPAVRTLDTGRPLSLSTAAAGTDLTYHWRKNGVPIAGATSSSFAISAVTLADAGDYDCVVTNSVGDTATSITNVIVHASPFAQQPASQAAVTGGAATFTVTANAAVTYRWQRNGVDVAGGNSATLGIAAVQPADTGLYAVIIDDGSTSVRSDWALLGVQSAVKVVGDGTELQPTDIPHPNGNIFDQVLVTGPAETITADYAQNQITRTSFLDPDGDIVQVEFVGPGSLSLVLDSPSGPTLPAKYNQNVTYMSGRAGIVITGADERTNVSVFTVGRATAFDGTGHYNILLPPSATNDPATNGSPLFVGHEATDYDGIADLAFVAIASANGKFGGVRAANARFTASHGATGVYAPGVEFLGPVFIGDISASGDATPVIILGSAADTRITGGNLAQANFEAVQVRGISQLKFTAGSDANGDLHPAQPGAAFFDQDGNDVTNEIVVNPAP
ncbi:MAG TPA: glycoside hydrolase family 44 protein [Opitutus sp.]|nr:glycoside hydrolase family 44 protein [Opitutus sp.]